VSRVNFKSSEKDKVTRSRALDDHNSSTSGSRGGREGGGGEVMDDDELGKGGKAPFGLFISPWICLSQTTCD